MAEFFDRDVFDRTVTSAVSAIFSSYLLSYSDLRHILCITK